MSADGENEFHTEVNEACLLYFTSGTTGDAKLVKHTHVSYPYGHSITGKYWLELRPGHMLWNMLDQGWAKAMWAFFGAWTQGATLFLDGDTSPFDPDRTVRLLQEHPITTFCGAPIIYRQLVGRGSDAFVGKFPKALKHCTSAGENLASRVIMDWHEMTGLIVYNGFGQTEASILCGSYPSMTLKMDSMGMPLPGVPLEILNDEGETAAPFEEGAIAVNVSEGSEFRGIFEGYILEDGSVSRPTVTDEDGQIWYMTGDRAHSDEYGYFFYKGRGDDVIILPAIGLAGPAEIEAVLNSHPAVRQSVAVAAPDERRGHIVKAFIVLNEGQEDSPTLKQKIRELCLEHKAAHYCPQRIEFVAADFLPKTVSEKVIRKELRMLEMP